jgi:hypothetical protein
LGGPEQISGPVQPTPNRRADVENQTCPVSWCSFGEIRLLHGGAQPGTVPSRWADSPIGPFERELFNKQVELLKPRIKALYRPTLCLTLDPVNGRLDVVE